MNKMIGRCRFCGQSRIVAAAPDDATQELLDQIAQKVFEEKYSHEEFMREFGRNWL